MKLCKFIDFFPHFCATDPRSTLAVVVMGCIKKEDVNFDFELLEYKYPR